VSHFKSIHNFNQNLIYRPMTQRRGFNGGDGSVMVKIAGKRLGEAYLRLRLLQPGRIPEGQSQAAAHRAVNL
jgi:hypothetical protein